METVNIFRAENIEGRVDVARAVGSAETLMFIYDLAPGQDSSQYHILAAERASAPDRYGPLAGVLRTNERYGVVLAKDSPLTGRVDAAVRALVRNGTLSRLERRWLLTDLRRLPVLG
jgi:hypothetical protein